MTRNSNSNKGAEPAPEAEVDQPLEVEDIRPAADGTNVDETSEGEPDPEPTPEEEADALDEIAVQMVESGVDYRPKVGDTIALPAPSGLVRLPDGTVATCRGAYTARHPGEHVFFTHNSQGEAVETTVEVGK